MWETLGDEAVAAAEAVVCDGANHGSEGHGSEMGFKLCLWGLLGAVYVVNSFRMAANCDRPFSPLHHSLNVFSLP